MRAQYLLEETSRDLVVLLVRGLCGDGNGGLPELIGEGGIHFKLRHVYLQRLAPPTHQFTNSGAHGDIRDPTPFDHIECRFHKRSIQAW